MTIPTFSNYMFTPFHSLEENGIGDSGTSTLANALTVNQSLKILRYIRYIARNS